MNLKRKAARHALQYVRDGMTIGLGTGSTTSYFIAMLGEKIKSGQIKRINGVPTSEASALLADSSGIPITTLAEVPQLDLVIDGADEVDPYLNLIKGLGRALVR